MKQGMYLIECMPTDVGGWQPHLSFRSLTLPLSKPSFPFNRQTSNVAYNRSSGHGAQWVEGFENLRLTFPSNKIKARK